MKNGIITIIIFTIILIVFYLAGEVYISNSSIDIHIHDTYFVLSYWIITIGIISL
jgi:heme/copper-type cytochrome/quinol oxidase subunit 1